MALYRIEHRSHPSATTGRPSWLIAVGINQVRPCPLGRCFAFTIVNGRASRSFGPMHYRKGFISFWNKCGETWHRRKQATNLVATTSMTAPWRTSDQRLPSPQATIRFMKCKGCRGICTAIRFCWKADHGHSAAMGWNAQPEDSKKERLQNEHSSRPNDKGASSAGYKIEAYEVSAFAGRTV